MGKVLDTLQSIYTNRDTGKSLVDRKDRGGRAALDQPHGGWILDLGKRLRR